MRPASPGKAKETKAFAPRRWAIVGIALALVVAGLGLVGYRGATHRWPWAASSTTLHVCGRDFEPQGASESRAQIAHEGYHLIRYGRTPGGGQELWSFDSVEGQHADPLPGGCHVVMWVRAHPDDFQAYVLLGGP